MSLKIQVKNTRHGNPGVSGWYAILPEAEPARVLQEDITADWLVIVVDSQAYLQQED